MEKKEIEEILSQSKSNDPDTYATFKGKAFIYVENLAAALEASQREAEGLRKALRRLSRQPCINGSSSGLTCTYCRVCQGAEERDDAGNPEWDLYPINEQHDPDCWVWQAIVRTKKE